jgi:hypothetical protein
MELGRSVFVTELGRHLLQCSVSRGGVPCFRAGELAGFSLLLDERGDESCDQILAASRKRDGLLEDALQFADGARGRCSTG